MTTFTTEDRVAVSSDTLKQIETKAILELFEAQQTRAEIANIKPSTGTPVPAKAFAQGVLKDLKKVNVKESYWTKLQNERNTKIAKLVNELKESVK